MDTFLQLFEMIRLEIPSQRSVRSNEWATNPRTPTSIVNSKGDQLVVVVIWSISCKYRFSFRSWASSIFSSDGHVSSINKIFWSFSDQITISGHWSVAKTSGGKTEFESGRSTSNLQLLEPAIKPEYVFVNKIFCFCGCLASWNKRSWNVRSPHFHYTCILIINMVLDNHLNFI